MVFIPNRANPVDIQIRDAQEFLVGLRRAEGTVLFTANPASTDQIVIGDGENVAKVYEFHSGDGVDAPKIGVFIGVSKEATAENLVTAINAQVADKDAIDQIIGVMASTEENLVSLLNTVVGEHGNITITSTEASECMSILGMVNGSYAKPLDVVNSNPSTPVIIVPFSKTTNSTMLVILAVKGSYTFTVASATGIVPGSYLVLFHPDSIRFSQFYCVSVVDETVTVDSPIDFEYPVGTYLDIGTTELSVNGSVTPQVFGLRGLGTPQGIAISVNITRLIFTCLASSTIDLSLFGNIAALTRGLLVRKRATSNWNILNVKSNQQLTGVMFDYDVYVADNPSHGVDGFTGRLTFGGHSKMGVVQQLAIGEDLEVIIQDNLSAITSLTVMAEGHIVDPIK